MRSNGGLRASCRPAIATAALLLAVAASADDWPTYRHDAQRSAVSTERVKTPLSEEWVFRAPHPPSHAWGDPQPKPVEEKLELPRLRFDDAFHVVSAGALVYFGSSSENRVYALEAGTGEIRWEFYTDGPVRLAPTVWNGKVYVGSDDGKVYCLAAEDGRRVWTFSAAPTPEMVLGNGKMVSRWPVRTGVLVDDGMAYFGAGVFPADGLYLYAVDAEDGKLLWKNDTYDTGGRGMVSPQGYLVASTDKLFVPSGRTTPAAFAREDGRFLFQRNFNWRSLGLNGGTYVVLADDLLFNGTEQMVAFSEADGQVAFAERARRLAVGRDFAYLLTGEKAMAVRREGWAEARASLNTKLHHAIRHGRENRRAVTRYENQLRRLQRTPGLTAVEQLGLADEIEAAERQRYSRQRLADSALAAAQKLAKQLEQLTEWCTACACTDSVLLTSGVLFAGGANMVKALDTATGDKLWAAKVNGAARSLAVARGRLFVSTDKGRIHCFASGQDGRGRQVAPLIVADPFGENESMEALARADEIVDEGGVTRGYALVIGPESGRLALGLARQTELMIYVVEPDANRVAQLRRRLSLAGAYGARVVAMQAGMDSLPYADYFANLIVCQELSVPAEEVLRMLKPCGGVALLARKAEGRRAWVKELRKGLDRLDEGGTKITNSRRWVMVRRGALAGAGRWTHQYADPGNTGCSDDQLVRGPLGILWYGEPGPARMPSRHAANSAPLAVGGRMFVQGENVIMAYDAYNGLLLWEREIEGAMRLGIKGGNVSDLAANDDSLFVAVKSQCYRLNPATGDTVKTYEMPVRNKRNENANQEHDEPKWLYVACAGRLLYGSRGDECIFALDIESGNVQWAYDGQKMVLNTICIGDGRVFLVDRSVTEEQRERYMKGVQHEQRSDRRGEPVGPDVRRVVALDAATGKPAWTKLEYVSDCVKVGIGAGDLTAMYADQVLLLCGQAWNGHWWREFLSGAFSRRSLIALSADDGRSLWSGYKGYRSRPLIIGDSIVAEPCAHDLHTGDERLNAHPVTTAPVRWQFSRPAHHCGAVSAAPNALFFRSSVTAYYDLIGDYGTVHFGAQRPGCWINCIPANGVVMVPEAASGCVCGYSVHCTMVFKPYERTRLSGICAASGPMVPVKHLAIDLGAIGDRRDSNGTLWLAYPRPQMASGPSLDLRFGLAVSMLSGGGYFRGGSDASHRDAIGEEWVFSSGCRGLRRCSIPVNVKGVIPSEYTVRLYFAEPDMSIAPSERVFGISLQGEEVLSDFDIAAEAAGKRGVVKTFVGVTAGSTLDIAFTPSGPAAETGPVLCGVEIVTEELRLEGGYDGLLQFQAPSCVRKGEPYVISQARLRGAKADRGAMYYRHQGEDDFSSVDLERMGEGGFGVILPSEFTEKPFEYYLEMQAGETRARAPAHRRLVQVRPDATPPSPVQLLAVKRLSNYGAQLSWLPAHDDDRVLGYRVTRKTKWGEKEIARLGPGICTFTDNTFAESRIQRKDYARYGVQAIDHAGRRGDMRYISLHLPNNLPPAVSDLKVRALSVDDETYLSWAGEIEPDVAEIRILRGSSEKGPFDVLATLGDPEAYGYVDEEKGTSKNWYALVLVDRDEVESKPTVPVPVKKLPMPDVFLSDLDYVWGTAGADEIRKDQNTADKPLKLRGKTYERGIGTHAESEIVYDLKPSYTRFVALFGIDDRPGDRHKFNRFRNLAWVGKGRDVICDKFGSVTAQVHVDGKCLHESPVLHGGDVPWPIDLPIPQGSKQIKLVVTDGGDDHHWDIADWVNAGFVTGEGAGP